MTGGVGMIDGTTAGWHMTQMWMHLLLHMLEGLTRVGLRQVFVQTLGGRRCGHGQLLFQIVGLAARRLPVRTQSGGADVLLIATLTHIRPIVGVQPLVELQMYELCELLWTQIASIRLLTAVQTQVSLQIRRRGETLLADVTLMRLLSGMHQMMLLQVRQLCEALRADIAFEWSLAGMCTQMHFQIAQLTEGLATDVAFVMHLAIFLLQRIWQ